MKVDGTGARSNLLVDFGTSGVETSRSIVS